MPVTAQQLASKFAELLRDHLGAEKIAEVDRRNAAEANPIVCHSHDFVDANEVMADAFQRLSGRFVDLDSNADSALWNEAWDIAAKTGFGKMDVLKTGNG